MEGFMRVLLINHFPLQGSGSGIYTLNIALELIKEGHQVFVIDIDNQLDETRYPFERTTILCNEKLNSKPDLKFDFPCFTTHPRSNNTYYNLSAQQINEYVNKFIQTAKVVVKNFKPDIIHAQHLWITPYAAMKSGVPYVITVHGTDLMGFKKDKRFHKYAIAGAHNAKKIITISHRVHKDTLKLFNFTEEKLILNPNGFDSNIFNVEEINKSNLFKKFGIKNKPEKVVSFVGKFTNFKGIDVLINAAEIVTKKIPKVSFALAGDGELRTEMEKLAKKFRLDNIFFLGQQKQIDVALLYNLADVSVVPSRIEPFGLVAIEALACGTPVVATNAGGLPDFVNDKVGRLVEMNNKTALATAIIEELNNNSKQNKGKYSAQYAIDNYSWGKTLEKVIEIYETALE